MNSNLPSLICNTKIIMKLLFVVVFGVAAVGAEVYFKDYFTDGDWQSRWTQSEHKSDYGKWILTAGKYFNDEEQDKGLQTSQDAKFYAISSSFDKFSNEGKDLVVQFSVKHEQNIDCGGGYVKLFPSDLKGEEMHGDSTYNIMFGNLFQLLLAEDFLTNETNFYLIGPDICGPGTKKVHVIFHYKGKNLLIKKDVRCKDDETTHVYTLIVKPDNTYEVLIDNSKAQSGSLEEDWDFLEPKQIKDPDQKKPSQDEWDEREKIADPNAEKPEDWDKPEHIVDPDAKMPEDWDEDMDGEWEPPMIDNPEYKGEWTAPMIDNPDYKGKWVHPMIDNPEYVADDKLYMYSDFGAIGLDLWQVKSGTIFDNLLITDDAQLAKDECDKILKETVAGEKKMKDAKEEEDRKAAEAAAADEDEEEEEEEEEDVEGEDEIDQDSETPEEVAEDEEEEKLAKDEL